MHFIIRPLGLILLLIGLPSLAQANLWKNVSEDALTVKLGITGPSLDMALNPPETSSGESIDFQPHLPGILFLGLSYDIVGVSLSTVLPMGDEERDLLGETQYVDFQFRFYFPKMTYEIFFQEYKGYYIENSGYVDSQYEEGDPKLQLPDHKTKHFGLATTYLFNEDEFSMSAAFDQSARQTSSGGSWLLMATTSYYLVDSQSGLAPRSVASEFGDIENVKSAEFYMMGVGGGYGHTWASKSYYCSVLLMVGPGLQYQRTTDLDEIEKTGWENSLRSNGRVSVGYNGESFFSGFSVIADNTSLDIGEASLDLATIDSNLFVGRHF